MKKVVLDTNVIIAAFTARGLASSVFELCIERFEVVISEYIINEISDKLVRKLKVPQDRANELISFLKEFCTIEAYAPLEKRVCSDIKDDNILALAQGSKSDYIVTGDKDLLVLNKFGQTIILNPRQLWQEISSNSTRPQRT